MPSKQPIQPIKGFSVIPLSVSALGAVTFTDGTNEITPNQVECEAYGYTYDSVKDKFICPQPFASWALDESDDWQAPTPYPEDDESLRKYYWDEDTASWVSVDS